MTKFIVLALLLTFPPPSIGQKIDSVGSKGDCTKYLIVEKEGDSYPLIYSQISISLLDSMFFNDIKKECIKQDYTRFYLYFYYEYHLDSFVVRVYPDFASQSDHHFNYYEEEEEDMIERVKKYPIKGVHILYKDLSRNYCVKAIFSNGKVRFTSQ